MTQTKAELLETKHQGDIRLGDANSSHYVGFKAPATVSSSLVWTLPAADGSANQFLKTNASGVLSWGTVDTSTLMPLGGGTFTGDVTFDGATAGRDIVFDRSDNALEFADDAKLKFGSELEIYSTGAASYIKDTGTGNLTFDVDNLIINNAADSATIAKFKEGDACELYFNNSLKFATNNTGVAITGAATISTDLTVTGDLTVSGTTTTINTQTLDVEDKNVVIGKVSSPSDTTADGGGWTLKGATDKTFNWVDSTNAWTSSEHIHLGDNKTLLVGTGQDLQIYHDGTNNILRNVGTRLDIIVNSSETAAVFNPNGSVDLYHDNSKKLETTSGGINVTGAINVNGAALSSAPTLQGTASGSIANASAVVVKSDGNFEQAAESITAITSPNKGSFSYTDATADNHLKTVWCPSIDRLVILYANNSGDSLKAKIINVSVSSGTTVASSLSPAFNGGGHSIGNQNNESQAYDIAWDDDNQILFIVWNQKSSNNTYCVAATVGSTGFTWGSILNVNSSNSVNEYRIACGYAGNGKFVVGYSPNVPQPYGKLFAVSVNSSTRACTKGTEVALPNSGTGDYCMGMCFGPVANDGSTGFIWLRYSGNNPVVKARSLTISGTTISMSSSDTQLNGGKMVSQEESKQPAISYDTDNDVYLCVYGELKDSGGNWYAQRRTKFRAWRTSGTTVSTVGSESFFNVTGTSYNDAIMNCDKALATGYDKNFNKHFVLWTTNSVGMRYGFVTTPASSSPTYTMYGSGNTIGEWDSAGNSDYQDLHFIESIGTTNGGVGNNSINRFPITVANASQKHIYNAFGGPFATSTSNVTDGSFIGFSSAAYSNGNTATVKTVGNTVTKSSLTPGTLYYLDKAGNLTTTSTVTGVIGGKALSSTSLLIKA